MATIEQFEEIGAWQKAREFSNAAYAVTGDGAFGRDLGGVALTSGTRFAVAKHLRKRFLQGGIPTWSLIKFLRGTTTCPLDKFERNQRTCLLDKSSLLPNLQKSKCDVPRRLAELMEELDISSRGYFKAHYLEPLIEGGVIRMTNPDKPRASNQRYVLTEAGVTLKAKRLDTKKPHEE